jgi:cobalt-zinc-cadmium efflux system outer membrane protein
MNIKEWSVKHRAKATVLMRGVAAMAVVCLAITSRTSSAAEAAETNAPTLTLEALVADTLANNPELNFYKEEVAVAKGERQAAGVWTNPEVAGTAGSKRTTGGGVSGEGLTWSVSVKQTFEWPGRIGLRKAIANRQIHLAELGYGQFRAALEARARALALGVYAAQEKAAAAREVAGRYQALREVLVQREPAGLTPVLETRIIEATEVGLQRKASEAAIAEQAALLELNQLRGQPPNTKVRIEVPALEFAAAPETESLLAAARTNNFELRMRQAELEQQGFKAQLARNEKYPALTVEPYFSREKAADQETQAGIGLSVPLPLWNRNEGKVASEEARRQQAGTSLFVAQQTVERQVVEKAGVYRTKLEEMSKWRPDSVQQFKEAAALADRHYRLGAVPIATYVELQKQYLEAVEALLDTKREALEAGQQIRLLTGIDFNAGQTNKQKENK